MARVSTYLNFPRETEKAFNFYRSVFGGEFTRGIMRFRDIPAEPDQPQTSPEDLDLVMHVELPILGGHVLMGTDAPESMGFKVQTGNHISINLEPDTTEEADSLIKRLAEGGEVTMEPQNMFWGGYFGSCTDQFGIQWMVNVNQEQS